MKNVIVLLFCILTLTSCSKEPIASKIVGEWTIEQAYSTSTKKDLDVKGQKMTFDSEKKATLVGTNQSLSGSWRVITETTNDDEYSSTTTKYLKVTILKSGGEQLFSARGEINKSKITLKQNSNVYVIKRL